MKVQLSQLVEAFHWASEVGPFENRAYVNRVTGEVWLVSDLDDSGDDPPDNLDDESLFALVPNQNELDLGRTLALQFARECIPDSLAEIQGFFRAHGAYGKFKGVLESCGRLEEWYAFEARGIEQALRLWASRCGIEVSEIKS